MTDFIPPAKPIIGEDERAAVDRVLRSGMLAQGPEVAAFEEEFAEHFGLGRACVAVNSGTSGQHLGLLSCGVGAGDEVIVPSFTFAATANSVALTGATPVFADIDADDFCLSPEAVEAAITERTVGVMPVHLYGHPAEDGPDHRDRAGTRPPGLRGCRPGARCVAARHPGRAPSGRSRCSRSTRPRT